MNEGRIMALDANTVTLIHSQTNVFDIAGCVSELVQNAIDADAKNIDIAINIPQLSVTVSDDGIGIHPFDMDKIGQHYYTSKCQSFEDLDSLSTFGFRGEALASIAAASLFSLTSRHVDYPATRTVKYYNSKRLFSGASNNKLNKHGTIVSVSNMYSNTPVRRRHLLSIPEVTHIQSIKELLVQFAVVKPDLSVFLRNCTGKILLFIGASPRQNPFTREVQILQSIFGTSLASQWDTVEAESAKISVRGVISLSAVASRSSQFIILNKRLTYIGDLFRVINKIFRSSSYARTHNIDFATKNQKNLTSSRPFAKYPAFILSISCPQTSSDICQDPSKIIYKSAYENDITFTVKALCKKFLQVHNFSLATEEKIPPIENELKRNHASSKNFLESGGDYLCHDLAFTADREIDLPIPNTGVAIYDSKKQYHKSNTRNQVINTDGNKQGEAVLSKKPRITNFLKSTKQNGEIKFLGSHNKSKPVENLGTPVFAPIEIPIPSLDTKAVNDRKGFMDSSRFFSDASSDNPSGIKIAREDLKNHEIIAQVGEKFILDKIYVGESGKRKPLLLLIDQHAADERIRVERYISDFLTNRFLEDECVKPNAKFKLSTPAKIEVTIKEAALIQYYQEPITQWGTLYKIINQKESSSPLLIITHIPSIAADRSLDFAFLKRLVIQHAYDMAEYKVSKKPVLDGTLWWTKLRSLPNALLELIISKACRSSIMFGERLEHFECEDLINKLAKCRFPFQCAHGRPSMTPLVDLSISMRQKNGTSNYREVIEEAEYQVFSSKRLF
ncbi:hypothetical protein NADFUDRAFT_82502 [Nadsonia fulvescens var. elongata DSM 6958]|uniref:MutL C-terminal dimerisation domain-containing protein n=1 Tax=Nadsonia fulvescens var. elongata DSM 6958 TaxID=857566 RepID=A0A1E3PMY5_9ASCO|nr:hypothetical protein NADFUDRAFT_82502 [Nadsonia fulvescens var. elongata DSM 6958]